MRSELVAMMIGALVLGTTACCSTTPLERHWGEAARSNAQSMVVNPLGTSESSDPGAVADGVSTENYLGRLRAAQSKKTNQESTSPIFNIGTMGGK